MRILARGGSVVPAPLLGCSILVLADEPFLAHCLQAVLQDAGADVIGTTSPAEALSYLERLQPSAVVLDTVSTSKNAQQIHRRLARLRVPCVICSSGESLEPGPKGVVTVQKPVRGTLLIDALSRITQTSGAAPAGTKRRALQPMPPAADHRPDTPA
jgi:CheY-like chemotaxis protein